MKNSKFKIQNSKSVFAKKSLGQNFLIDETIVRRIVDELNLQTNETIIEIGAGRGALTRELLKRAGRVAAIELDKDLILILRREFANFPNFELIEADALRVNFGELLKKSEIQNSKFKIAANLPYYISTAILQRFIEQRQNFGEMILMFQREVVERITAAPCDSERGFLTVLIQAFMVAEKLFDVPPEAFRPRPKVWSSVVRLTIKNQNEVRDENLFRRLLSAGFAQKRKTILNNLKLAAPDLRRKLSETGTIENLLERAKIEPNRRAESLTLVEWLKLMPEN